MSLHSLGQKRGGVRTIEDMRIRCRVDDDTDCWHWLGSLNSGRGAVYLPAIGATRTVLFAACLLTGRETKAGQRRYLVCASRDCCNPEHVKIGTSKQIGRFHASIGRLRNIPERFALNRKTARGLRHLTDEQAREIRESSETGVALAARFGTTKGVISRIRRHQSYREDDLMPGVSVFAWRKAA